MIRVQPERGHPVRHINIVTIRCSICARGLDEHRPYSLVCPGTITTFRRDERLDVIDATGVEEAAA